MKGISGGSIDMVLTSPPYDNLRTYESSLDWNENVWKKVIEELFRIVKKGGVVVWVVNDATINGSETGTSFKQALYFKEVGFNLHDTMIYTKTGIPYPDTTRYYNCFEYMFILSIGRPKTINLIKDRANKWPNIKSSRTSRKRDGSITESFSKRNNRYSKEIGVRFNVWEYKTGYNHSYKEDYLKSHPAIFPEKLAADHIKSWSNEGDTILDPFAGSGTTGKIANQLKRNCILIEKHDQYVQLIQRRINEATNPVQEVLAFEPWPWSWSGSWSKW
jgi:site-specific DNA-methyltransferase (adenine-specific)